MRFEFAVSGFHPLRSYALSAKTSVPIAEKSVALAKPSRAQSEPDLSAQETMLSRREAARTRAVERGNFARR
jgi:hypothetical protein